MAGSKQSAVIFNINLRTGPLAWIAVVVFAAAIHAMPVAEAQTFTVLHSFSDKGDGGFPYAGVNLIVGNLYGTTSEGGQYGSGTVYELKHRGSSWTLSTLYNFTGGSDGAYPYGRVTAGPGGILYGTTAAGGDGFGTVFTLRLPATACHTAICPWIETVLYRFQGGSDGAYPEYADDLVFDQAGNIYGTTSGDTNGDDGTVFELSPSNGGWTETILHHFTNGEQPFAGVIFDAAGNLYGTTPVGGIGYGTVFTEGPSNFGLVFKLTPSGGGWTETNLTLFGVGNNDGIFPYSSVILDASGNVYGTTIQGGSESDGTVWEITP